jgi:short subunit dehydrogenase-like uncharacterized protein
MSDARPYALVLYGATGFTGGLTARYLSCHLPRDVRWAIAGRHRDGLEKIAAALEQRGHRPDLLIACSDDDTSLDAMAARTRVLASTVGPYVRHGEPLVRACISQGTHYCDLTGEPEFVNRLLLEHHAAARDAGCAIVNSCGFDSIPYDAGVLFTINRLTQAHGRPLDQPVTVEGALTASAEFSGGTWHSALEAFARPGANRDSLRRANEQLRRDYPRQVATVPFRARRDADLGGWLAPLPTIDPMVVLRSARALERYGPQFRYGHYLASGNPLKLGLGAAAVGALIGAAQVGPLRRWLLQRRPAGEGPDAATRARSWFQVRLRGRCGDSEVLCRVSGGDPGYDETACMLAETAMALALDPGQPRDTGVITPMMALRDQLLERLINAGIRFEEIHESSG